MIKFNVSMAVVLVWKANRGLIMEMGCVRFTISELAIIYIIHGEAQLWSILHSQQFK